MREFKFRGYDKRNKRMFNVYGLGEDWCTEDTMDGVNEGTNCWNGEDFRNNIEVMQFPGETDCNNIDLYESDIVRCYIDGEEIGALDVIEFKYGAFILRHRNVSLLEWNSMPNDTYSSELKVIGNIYEHPELLK